MAIQNMKLLNNNAPLDAVYPGGIKYTDLSPMSLARSRPVKANSRVMASVPPYGMGVSSASDR